MLQGVTKKKILGRYQETPEGGQKGMGKGGGADQAAEVVTMPPHCRTSCQDSVTAKYSGDSQR